jgi:hypothetical protein
MLQEQTELLGLLASYAYDPYGHTLACFPWAEGELETSAVQIVGDVASC